MGLIMESEDYFKFLQCESCKKNFEDFLKNFSVTREQEELLAKYTLFCEIQRLKEKQVTTIFNPPDYWGGIHITPASLRDLNIDTVTC